MKKIYFYPGRFQPMGPHHAEVFSKIMSDYDTESIGPFIVTSNKVELPKSPLNFEEKKQVMVAHGIPGDRIIQVSNPYYAKEILFDYDSSEVEAVYLVGAKDMAEDPRFKKTEGTTKEGYKWSIEVAPHIEKDIEGEEMSGTTLRKTLANADEETFYSIMGFEDKKIHNLLTQKFSQIEEDFYDPKNKYYDFAKSSEWKAGMPDGPKDDIPRKGDQIHNRQSKPLTYEQQGGKTLRVYDFDDTLAVTRGANIKVKHEDGTIDTLDPAEFAIYKEQPGDKFDFTEFDSVIKEATPIQHIVDMLKQDVSDASVDKVTILTARLLAYPVKRYIREDLGLDVYVVAVGSSDPLDKATWIEDHILKGYNDIMFIDDSEPNRKAVEALRDIHDGINLEVFHPSDLSEMMMGTMTKAEKRKHKRKLKKIKKGLKKHNKGNKYFKVPKSWRGSLTRKLYKEHSFEPKLHPDNPYDHENIGHYTTNTALINDLTIPLETMRTPEEQTTGMMDRKELKGGMAFPYDDVSRKDFHMEGCLIPLDIVFVNKGTIDTIHADCPPCKETPCPKYSGLADNVLELPGGYCKKNNINVGDDINFNLTENKIEENVFTKEWWKQIIKEQLLTEGGAAGHMAHPFNLPDVNSGGDLKDIFNKAAKSLKTDPGSVKIDGVNSSIRLIDLEGEKQFVMDRGSKKALDIKGVTKDDLVDRFKKKDGSVHGMIAAGGAVLDIFNEALPSIKDDLEKLGAYNNPNILFNMEYVEGKTNVQDYGSNFIAIHGLNQIELDRTEVGNRESKEISYDKSALQSLLDKLAPIAKERGFEVYGSVPTEMTKDPNFSAALSQNYTIVSNEGEKTQTLDAWLNELNDIPEKDFIFMNVDNSKKKVGAVSKQVYTTLLKGDNIDELFEDENDKQKAIEGFTTYLATEKLGDEVLKVLDSPMGSVDNHEGVVIRDEDIANVPFKITGKFILGGMTSDF